MIVVYDLYLKGNHNQELILAQTRIVVYDLYLNLLY